MDSLKQQASAALDSTGLDASKVQRELAEHGKALKESAVRLAGNDWQVLEQHVGQYPADLGLFTYLSPIAPELKKLLGDKIAVLRANTATQGPLSQDRVLYVTGNKAHQGGMEAGYVLIDTQNRKLEVGLVEKGKLTVYASPGEVLYRPMEVQAFIGNIDGK
ncbi:hypothetical protein [Andreprevotia sp. IGB-42]|uniref:hypothetical protein n=1 Tax=Andreprevotia sp. IGB-42 TaxID=2497473 RepID=UPI001359B393|nr:hypothetical protein [Andreprevotia sp. IGB-42]